MMVVFEVLTAVATAFVLIYLYAQYCYGHWAKRGVPSAKNEFPFGSVKGLSKVANLGMILKNKYHESRGLPFYGMNLFFRPILLIRDPQLIKEVLVKNFSSFQDRGFHFNTEREPLLGHLFFLEGKKWRNMRIKMAPTFTSGKIKMMFPTIIECGQEMIRFLKEPADMGESVNVKDVFSKFTINVISRCAFGLDIDSFRNPDSEFRKVSNFLFEPDMIQAIKTSIMFSLGKVAYYVPFKLIPTKNSNFFINAVADVMREREESNIRRNDFMQLLIELKKLGRLEDSEIYSHGELLADEIDPSEISRKFTLSEAAAQAFVFFVAGFETASTTIQFCLFELAQNRAIQEKLQEEIDSALKETDGLPKYESVQSMTYLDQVISETLRKYPSAPFLVRECRKQFPIPESDVVLAKGTRVMISLLGLHNDPVYFPNPESFNPDRFNPSNSENIRPFTYMPFGEGPRICIGMRFGLMQVKMGLVQFLAKYSVELCDKSPKAPLEFDPKALLTVLKGTMHLKIRNR